MDQQDCTNLEAASRKLADTIRFTDLPRTSKLFNDFLYDYPSVSRFYSVAGRGASSLINNALQVGAAQFDRKRVADALDRINAKAGSPELTFQHIDALRRPGTVAVVTGQQAGLFTGPLYTVHKAITAIKLARCLSDHGIEAVPVFWVASEDHDYEEVNHCRVIDRDGHLAEVRYEASERIPDQPVGRIRICERVTEKIDQFVALLPASEFVTELEQDLRESYRPGIGFAEAFSRLLARMFRNYGVVLLDPLDEELKQVAAPLYAKALEQSPEIAAALLERSAELERGGYHAQVHVSDDMVPLFIMDNGRRAAMVHHRGRFFVKGSDRSYGREELIELAQKCPACFSPNVTLRPIVQDYLLPTAAYIGGPAEIAYFAQLDAVYDVLGRSKPCLLPRASFTIVEGRHQKAMKKYGLHLSDFFEGLHPVITKVVEQGIDRDTAKAFSETEKGFNSYLDKLEQTLRRSDATLAASLKRARERIFYQLDHLRTRFIHASARREETTYRQIERAYATLFPNKNFQERELNLYYFLSRYGPTLFNDIYEATDLGYSNHKLLYIGGVASQVVNAKQ